MSHSQIRNIDKFRDSFHISTVTMEHRLGHLIIDRDTFGELKVAVDKKSDPKTGLECQELSNVPLKLQSVFFNCISNCY